MEELQQQVCSKIASKAQYIIMPAKFNQPKFSQNLSSGNHWKISKFINRNLRSKQNFFIQRPLLIIIFLLLFCKFNICELSLPTLITNKKLNGEGYEANKNSSLQKRWGYHSSSLETIINSTKFHKQFYR